MYSNIALASSIRVLHFFRLSSSICIDDQNDSIIALSSASPTVPKEGKRPAVRIFWVNAHDVTWTPWSAWTMPPGPAFALGAPYRAHSPQGLSLAWNRSPSQRSSGYTRQAPPRRTPSFPRGMLRDICYPEFVRRQSVEFAMHEIISSSHAFQPLHPSRARQPVHRTLRHQYRDQPTRTRDLHPDGELSMNATVSVRSA